MPLTEVDHVVILVEDMDTAIDTWRCKLGFTLSHQVHLPEAGVSQAFFSLDDGTFIELVAPTSPQSPVAKMVNANGEGIHLLALRVDDLDATISNLQHQGVTLIGVGTPQVFIDSKSATGVMIQLWPKDRPHRWRDNPSEANSKNTIGSESDV